MKILDLNSILNKNDESCEGYRLPGGPRWYLSYAYLIHAPNVFKIITSSGEGLTRSSFIRAYIAYNSLSIEEGNWLPLERIFFE